jgi:pyruvate formate lyase activating enzyme
MQCEPIEKKPFFHVLPGSQTLTFGMFGCDMHCGYCQNWLVSQAPRDRAAGSAPLAVSPADVVRLAVERNASAVISSYNEPLVTAEWGAAVFAQAKEAGLLCGVVSNGNATTEVLRYLRPHVDLYKVDLKAFDSASYRSLGGTLQSVLDAIVEIKNLGFWLEVVTLVVPGFNDSDVQLRGMAQFLAGISPDIPWHVTAFQPDYRMARDAGHEDRTSPATLTKARQFGLDAGLRYVYAGNVPAQVGDGEDTRCPKCRLAVVRRVGFRVVEARLDQGRCAACRTPIPGIWSWPQIGWIR